MRSKLLKLIFTGFFLINFFIFTGCTHKKNDSLPLTGTVYDQVYFSPLGSFSVDLSQPMQPKTLEDAIVKEGSALVCNFKDEVGNHYSIMATYITDQPREDFIDKLIKKNQALGKPVTQSKTADGVDCYQESYLGKNPEGRYVAKLEIVFPAKLILYDIILTGRAEKLAYQATAQLENALVQFWKHTVFRGRLPELPGAPVMQDPRVPITVYAAQRTAEILGYTVDIQRTGKQIIRIFTQGKYSQVILSLGIQSAEHELVVTDAISCITQDEKFAAHIKMIFFDEFSKQLEKEKIHIKRSQVYDEDLLINPNEIAP